MPISLNCAQQQALRERSEDYLDQARKLFANHTICAVRFTFDLQGSAAGQYRPQESTIRYNSQIAALNYQAFKARTLVHEVSHHIVHEIWGGQHFHSAAPHGKEWRHVMRQLGVSDISRCHSYEMGGIKVKKQQRHTYQCLCQEHQISTTRHNRIQRGIIYRCKSCRQALTLPDQVVFVANLK